MNEFEIIEMVGSESFILKDINMLDGFLHPRFIKIAFHFIFTIKNINIC